MYGGLDFRSAPNGIVVLAEFGDDDTSVAGDKRVLLDRARELGARESGLVVVTTSRADGTVQASVVNAGLLSHPRSGELVVAFVARGATRKLVNLRRRPRATVVFRSGWDWVAIEGDAELAGPDDLSKGMNGIDLPALLRRVYSAAAGGTPEDWAKLDEPIANERHTAVLIQPVRAYSNADERR